MMFYATDTKNRIYAFDTEDSRNGLIYDCVTTDCWAISAKEAIKIMRKYISNAAISKTMKEWKEINEWTEKASDKEIARYYGSLIWRNSR